MTALDGAPSTGARIFTGHKGDAALYSGNSVEARRVAELARLTDEHGPWEAAAILNRRAADRQRLLDAVTHAAQHRETS